MSRSNLSKTQVFLMEFMIVVLFFAICVTICVVAFAKAEIVSKDTLQLNQAVILAQSGAETVKASWDREKGLPADAFETIGLEPSGHGDYIGFYDEDFHKTRHGVEAYRMFVDMEYEKNMMTADITVFSKADEEQIYNLQVKKYVPEGF